MRRDDRRVHAFGDSAEVVRYDRAGKWFIESKIGLVPARRVSINDAVDKAMRLWYEDNGSVNFGLPGGSAFDKKVRDRG